MEFLSILENRSCYLCGKPDDGRSGICSHCRNLVLESSIKKGPLCLRCSQALLSNDSRNCPFCASLPAVDRLYSFSYFNSYMKELLTLYKSGQMPCFRFFFASLVYDYIMKQNLMDAAIVPIPPRKGKIRTQGWDQIDLLCKTLYRCYGMNIQRVLERTDRIQQKTLNFEDREQHMKRILRIKSHSKVINNVKNIILLDDIYTSGATISAAANLIRQKYDGELSALVICSVI